MSELKWRRPDEYHIRSVGGRFAVCKLYVCDVIWYCAFEFKNSSSVRSHELGATRVPITASDEVRTEAIKAMQALCEATA